MFPNRVSELFSRSFSRFLDRDLNRLYSLDVATNERNISEPYYRQGNFVEYITPPAGTRLHILGMTLIGVGGNTGTLTIERENVVQYKNILLPLNVSVQSRSNGSSNIHISLDIDERIILRATGRGATDFSFLGVTYTISD